MKRGYLSEHFAGVAAKKLSLVEAHPERSNQHEFNGSNDMKVLFGAASGNKVRFPAKFVYFEESGDEPVIDTSTVTWYDARAKSAARTGRSEHRLYFPTNQATLCAAEGDLLLVARERGERGVLVVIAEGGSSIAAQLQWLFGLTKLEHPGFSVRAELETEQDRLGLAASLILEQIGVAADTSDETYLDDMLRRFDGAFPATRAFSAYARGTLPDVVAAMDCADACLVAWMEREEILFRTLEKHLLGDRLRQGFMVRERDPDVDGFLNFSLSVQNRRKARAGAALENHLEALFTACSVRFSRGAVTERNNKPDFLFPGAAEYHSPTFDSHRLTMLASKTTAKDRWRQVTKEADRIGTKHLITLEPAISAAQTQQMAEALVRLVVPSGLHESYSPAQRAGLMSLTAFVELVKRREAGPA